MGLSHHEYQSHVCEGELTELESILAALKTSDEPDKADDVENEADEPVMRRERQKKGIHEYDVLEIVHHSFSISKVERRRQKVPVDGLEPGNLVLFGRDRSNSEYLVENHYLHNREEEDDPQMTSSQQSQKPSDHDQGPDHADRRIALWRFVCLVIRSRDRGPRLPWTRRRRLPAACLPLPL